MHQISYWLQPSLTMRRIPVPSTSIASIGYLPTEHELEIKFRASGDVYRYFDVPGEEYARGHGGQVEGDLPEPGVQTSRVPLCCGIRRQAVSGFRCCWYCYFSYPPKQRGLRKGRMGTT